MATILLVEKIEDSLVALDAEGQRAMKDIPEKTILKISLSVPRNIRHHRMFFALLNVVFEAQPDPKQFPTVEKMLDAIKMATGHVREVRDIHGRTHIVPDSISFGRMDQTTFRQFFDSAMDVVNRYIIPGINSRDVEQRIADILREPGPDQLRR
jgi:hypothetical protein